MKIESKKLLMIIVIVFGLLDLSSTLLLNIMGIGYEYNPIARYLLGVSPLLLVFYAFMIYGFMEMLLVKYWDKFNRIWKIYISLTIFVWYLVVVNNWTQFVLIKFPLDIGGI